MVDSVGFSAVAPANAAPDPRGSPSSAAAPVADSGLAPAAPAKRPATYFSPQLRFDQGSEQLIVQYRNPDTGQVERQYPSRQIVQQYQQAEQQRQAVEAEARRQEITTGHPVNVQVQTDLNGQPVAAKPVPVHPAAAAQPAKPPEPAPAAHGSELAAPAASPAPPSSRGITA